MLEAITSGRAHGVLLAEYSRRAVEPEPVELDRSVLAQVAIAAPAVPSESRDEEADYRRDYV